MRAPVNALVHSRATPDTLRCSGRLDLADEPIVLSVPETCGRYYALWLRNEAGKVFASIGARTTGTGRRTFVLLGPGQRCPVGHTPIVASTRGVHVSGLIEAVDETLDRVMDGFQVAPLSGRTPAGERTEPVQDWPDPVADAAHAYAHTDVERQPLTGEHRYYLRFPPDAIPPVHGFWELTAGERSIGDRHPLALDPDGALTVHIQHTAPARARLWNWLPTPAGPFSLQLHRYWPRDETWTPPPITRLDGEPPAAGAGGSGGWD